MGIQLPDEQNKVTSYGIWPDHAECLDVFLRCITQWRAGPNGIIGLDYGIVLELAKLLMITDPLAMLQDLQVMEIEAREIMNSRMEK